MNSWQTSFRVLAERSRWIIPKKEYAQSNIAVIRKLLGVAEEGISESGTHLMLR